MDIEITVGSRTTRISGGLDVIEPWHQGSSLHMLIRGGYGGYREAVISLKFTELVKMVLECDCTSVIEDVLKADRTFRAALSYIEKNIERAVPLKAVKDSTIELIAAHSELKEEAESMTKKIADLENTISKIKSALGAPELKLVSSK